MDPYTRWSDATVDTDTSRQNRISLNNMELMKIGGEIYRESVFVFEKERDREKN